MVKRRRSVQDPRSRRMLSAFLKLRRRAGKPVEAFDAARMKQMLQSGQPDDAHYYLERFLPASGADWSQSCTELFTHVGVFKTFAKVVAGGEEGARIASLFANPGDHWLDSPASIDLHKMVALLHADCDRGSMLWQKLKPEGLDRIMDLVARCPELQGQVRMPRRRSMLWYTALHRISQCPSRCRKTTSHASSDALLREFLRKRLLTTQGRKRSARSRNASSQYATQPIKVELIALQPMNLEGEAANGECGDGCTGLVEKQALA